MKPVSDVLMPISAETNVASPKLPTTKEADKSGAVIASHVDGTTGVTRETQENATPAKVPKRPSRGVFEQNFGLSVRKV